MERSIGGASTADAGHNGSMTAPAADVVFDLLTARLPIQPDTGLAEIRRSGDEAVLMFRWRPHRHLFGVPVSLKQTHHRLDWDQPTEDLDDSLDLWLMEEVENGYLYRARRRQVDDYIELRSPGWPIDERFYVDVVNPGDADSWLRVPFMTDDGLNPDIAVMRREEGTLIAWVTAYENNATGRPYLGQAIVIGQEPGVARLDHVELVDDVPSTLVLDLIRSATHAAADTGAHTVVTDLDLPHLPVAGFRPSPEGPFTVNTGFLDEDPEAANALYRDDLADPGLWGRNRDAARRYLPRTRLGRLVHRLRHGPSGAPPRIYVG